MKKSWLVLILPALLLLWWGISRGGSAPVVHFVPVRTATIQSAVSTNGKVEPARWAAARAETSGVISSVDVQRGQEVSAGQRLVSLDTVAPESELAAALAKEQEARAESATLGQGGKPSSVASAKDALNSALAAQDVAQRNYDSMKRLQTQGAATKLQVSQAMDALDRAKLLVSAARDQLRTLVTSSDQTVAQAKLHDAQAAVSLARHRLALSSIVAPMAGTLYQFDLKVGAYLQPGQLVALVGNLSQMKATIYVDEPDLGRIKEGMPVTITWDGSPGRTWSGRVDQMPTEIVALGSRTVGEVTSIVDNPNHDLLPGVSINATIITSVVHDASAIPKAALRTASGKNGVYKLENGRIVWTAVNTGVSDINDVQVLSGLKREDLVADRVVDPPDAEITNDMRVKVALR
jgi:HlyD family secretion protein